MNDKVNIDKSIREKLDVYSVAPPPHVWDNIREQLAAKRRKKRLLYITWISAAAVVVFAFLAGWYFSGQTERVLPEIAEQKMTQSIDAEITEALKSDVVNVEKSDVFEAKTTASQGANKFHETKAEIAVSSDELTPENNFVASLEKANYSFLESLEAIFKNTKPEVKLAKHSDSGQYEIEITAIDEMLVAENLKNIRPQNSKENAWIVGVNLSPGYSSYLASYNEEYNQNMTYTSDNGNSNLGAGLSVQYKTGKRLRFESGVYYAMNGQSSSNLLSGIFDLSSSTDMFYVASEDIEEAQAGFANSIQLSSAGIVMNSTAGVITMQTTPQGVVVATDAEVEKLDYSNTLTTNGEFSQVFEFVEIPLYLRYSLIDKKFGLELIGGLNAGLVVGNNAYIDNEYGKQNIGSIDDISTLNLSGTVGLGMSYMLGTHLSMAVEPRLNYYLNSINYSSEVDFHPYRIGVFTGLYYQF
jgi:hypothetical protein